MQGAFFWSILGVTKSHIILNNYSDHAILKMIFFFINMINIIQSTL